MTSLRLPIVFLPAKFGETDTLQRLGIAFMGKPGTTAATIPPAPVNTVEKPKKRRRQSAPATSSGGRKKMSLGLGVARIEEAVIDE
jgi:hypothetical protein